jgi:hypothetical protein
LVLEFTRASAWPWGRDVGGEPCLEAEFRLNRTAFESFLLKVAFLAAIFLLALLISYTAQ